MRLTAEEVEVVALAVAAFAERPPEGATEERRQIVAKQLGRRNLAMENEVRNRYYGGEG